MRAERVNPPRRCEGRVAVTDTGVIGQLVAARMTLGFVETLSALLLTRRPLPRMITPV